MAAEPVSANLELGTRPGGGGRIGHHTIHSFVDAANRPTSHPQHVAQHAQGVDHKLDLAAIAYLGPDRDLSDRQAEPASQKQDFDVEGEAV